jgi:DNA polymerase beta
MNIKEFTTDLETLINLRKNQIDILNKCGKNNDASVVSFRVKNYEKWLKILSKFENKNIKLETDNDINNLDIPDKLKKRMLEFLNLGEIADIQKVRSLIITLKKNNIEKTNNTEDVPKYKKKKTRGDERPTEGKDLIIFDLQRINGIGEKTAIKYYEKGITLDKLQKEWKFINCNDILDINSKLDSISNTDDITRLHHEQKITMDQALQNTSFLKELNHEQILGIKYFRDIEERIPRNEVIQMETLIKNAIKHLYPDMDITVCGSFRRGNNTSGDIDTLLVHKKYIKSSDYIKFGNENPLSHLTMILTKIGFLKDHLTLNGKTKYMGLCALKNSPYARRIDIRFVPMNCFASALIYFTGSWKFNVMMRNHCIKKGYTLSEYGLKKNSTGEIIPFNTEEELFKFLDYPYKTPIERDIK